MKVREYGYEWDDAHNFEKYGELTKPEDVAESYVEWMWGNSPCNPEYFEENIEVMDNEGKVHKFNVTAEETVVFHVEKLNDVE